MFAIGDLGPTSGRFRSVDDVIAEAVRLMAEQESTLDESRARIDEGAADIEAGRTYSPDEAKAKLATVDPRVRGWPADRIRV